MNNLSCKLCSSSLQTPKMCPHCSQIFCEQCIRRYLSEKHFCPGCDNYIIDLVDCARLVSEVEQVVHAKKGSMTGKLCQLHELELGYFCQDCSKWICADCGVIEAIHREHRILNGSETFACHKEQIKKEILMLNEKIDRIGSKKEKCILDLEVYRAELKWAKTKIHRYCEELLTKVDNEGEKQIEEILEKINEYESNLQSLKKKQKEIEKIIQNETTFKPKLDLLISKNKSPLEGESLHEILGYKSSESEEEEPNIFFTRIRKIQVIDEIFPTFTNFTYEFDYQNFKKETFHYSDFFELWGQSWRLKIYPNGNSGVAGKYLSIFLELSNGHALEKPKKYIYKIELLSLNRAGSTIAKEYCSVFDSGESWGYSDYLNLENIKEYLHEGKLLFSIGIRNETHEGLCWDLKKYIGKIENDNKILEQLLCDGTMSSRAGYSELLSQSDLSLDNNSEFSIKIGSS